MRIGFDERVAQVRLLHQHADDLPEPLATLVRRHAASLESPREQIDAAVASATADIMKSLDSYDAFYLPGADPLAALRALSGLSDGPIEIPAPPDTPGDEPEVRLRAEHIYRLQRARGAQAAKFRAEVQRAYDFRCAFCGLRAPLVPGRMNAGVDAAHILPWGDYDLDVVRNGLMLCKQHHWAFDNRVLRLELAGGLYEVSFVPSAHAILSADPRTVALLQSVVGRIPADRLPISARNRPSALFLEEFNALAV